MKEKYQVLHLTPATSPPDTLRPGRPKDPMSLFCPLSKEAGAPGAPGAPGAFGAPGGPGAPGLLETKECMLVSTFRAKKKSEYKIFWEAQNASKMELRAELS
jgi:hypothetical protein